MNRHQIYLPLKVISDKLLWYALSTGLHMYISQAEIATPVTNNAE